ncbi:MAG: 5-demethoxyubiquinol-8 5-hydroxylase UbiM [Pseudomonadota bacterium]
MAKSKSTKSPDRCDVLIIGAGPAGLSFALSLRETGLDVRLVERQPEKVLAKPAYDGREIALSLRSVDILKKIGAWSHIKQSEISPLSSAKVINGRWNAPLHFDPDAVGEDQLGCFVANNVIRRALFTAYSKGDNSGLMTGAEMVDLTAGPEGGTVTLADGREIEADLVVAADTRFSAARGMAGITASTHDFGKTMIVTKVQLELPHESTAWECFLPGGTIAVLPLNDNQASIAQTLSHEEAKRQMALDGQDYLDAANQRLSRRFGDMTALSDRFSYPLISTNANRFVCPGFALVGDAAVGMHPITAHGFNLGVQGQSILAGQIRKALGRGRGPADPTALTAYAREHRRLSAGMYWSTMAIAELYARETLPAKLARRALLDAGRLLPPARRMLMKSLTQPLAVR